MEYELAKAILQRVPQEDDSVFFMRAYTMNLYRGCSHGCIYCDARSVCYRLDRPGVVRAKQNALAILEDELRRKRTSGIVGLGGMSDGYNPEEAHLHLTRSALSLLARYGFGIGITTKSPLVERDIDLLLAMQKNQPVHVTFSITTIDDSLSRILEPGVAPSSERFAALKAIADAGIPTGAWINPVLPFLTDTQDNYHALLHKTKECGGKYAVTFHGMTLREGNREYFYAALDRHFPGMKRRYAQAYGLDYIIPSLNAEMLDALYLEECKALGLAHSFAQVNEILRKSGGFQQESLL